MVQITNVITKRARLYVGANDSALKLVQQCLKKKNQLGTVLSPLPRLSLACPKLRPNVGSLILARRAMGHIE